MIELRVQDGPALALDRVELIVAGYTGRDEHTVAAHVAELAAHGIPRPDTIPAYYPVPAAGLATAPTTIGVAGADTSGEAEPVLIELPAGERFLAVGSDHTDREVERRNIAASKAACPKVVGREVWPLSAVADRWDELILSSRAGRRPYQRGSLAHLRRPEEILAGTAGLRRDPSAALVLFLGTVPLLEGEFRAERSFRARLDDPHGPRTLTCDYVVRRARQPTH